MEDIKPEEKSPLLLYLVEGEGNNVSKNNKRVNFDKGRLYGISSGATAVFTEFPNYFSPCWLTAIISSLIFFMMVLLMVSSMDYSEKLRVPRCTHGHPEDLDNRTIHLVHDLSNWNDEQFDILEMVKNQYEGYDVHLVLLRPGISKSKKNPKSFPLPYLIKKNISNTTTPTPTPSSVKTTIEHRAIMEIKRAKRGTRGFYKRKRRDNGDKAGTMSFGMGVKNLLDILLHSRLDSGSLKRIAHNVNESKVPLNLTELIQTSPTKEPPPKTLDEILYNFPAVKVINITYEEAFSKTPLEKTWFKLNKDLTIFAIRILNLWQYAGLSFKIDGVGAEKSWASSDDFSVAPEITLRSFLSESAEHLPAPSSNKLINFINAGKLIFDTLPKEIVTADDEGLHIFTKTPCHVFFGEILLNLQHARGNETPKFIIQQSLKVFCKHSAVDQNYCKNIIRHTG